MKKCIIAATVLLLLSCNEEKKQASTVPFSTENKKAAEYKLPVCVLAIRFEPVGINFDACPII